MVSQNPGPWMVDNPPIQPERGGEDAYNAPCAGESECNCYPLGMRHTSGDRERVDLETEREAPVPMKILLLDDEAFELRLMEHQLRRVGFTELTSCQDASEALAVIDDPRTTPDAILCDLQMPQMDGVEFVRALGDRHYAGVVVLVSGEDERILHSVERLAKAYELQIPGIIHKPVTKEALQALLDVPEARPTGATTSPFHREHTARQLQAALASGDIVNFYQPQVDLQSSRVVGMEALVRWMDPEDGLILPGQFITLAEEHGLIDDLTRRVLALALDDLAIWRRAGLDLTVSVNVSMASLSALNFVDLVSAEIERAQVPPANLVLEVTESRLMQDRRGPLDILNRLRLRRIGLSIDDFGTGHSSLVQLRDIPFTELKMDQSFVHGAHHDPSLQAMLEANLRMARELSMTTVAEGIEDIADWDYLASTDCDLAQGYFVARPMPAGDVMDWIAGWTGPRSKPVSPSL